MTGTPRRRELGTLGSGTSEKWRKQAIVLAVGWKCGKHWSKNGIPGPALPLFVMPAETR